MIELNFGKETRHRGIRSAFGIAMSIATWFVLQTGFIAVIGIFAGVIAIVVGLILLKTQKVLGILPCLSLLPLGFVFLLYAVNTWAVTSFGERLLQSTLTMYYGGYFAYGVLQGLLFLGDMFSLDK
ncbi:MAG: hypothetical protein IKA80_09045 [Spirochaetaceae bacterium]|nr:hypothetical protein [Spirochaetaceae bacterium]